MKKVLPAFIVLLITAATTAFIYKDRLFPSATGEGAAEEGRRGGGGMGQGRRRGGGGGANRTVPVLTETAKTANVPVYLDGVGTVQAYYTTTVRAQVSGRLLEVNYQEGQDVKIGDVLAKIDPVIYQAAYDQAVAKKAMDQALLENAKLDFQRYSGLAKQDYASKQQADTQKALVAQYEAQIRQDQAAIDDAKANLDYTTIRAPINGRTGIRQVDPGNLVSSTDATGIVVITQLQPISVIFTLPETVVSDVIEAKSKGTVPLSAAIGKQTIAEGTLEVIDNQIDQTTGTLKLKGTFPNEKFRLWPGQFVNIRLHLKTLENATVVPSAAIQQGASGSFVYIAADGKAKLTNVKITQEDESQAVIADGVKPGDVVITSGFASLQDGAKISVEVAGQPGNETAAEAGQGRRHRGTEQGSGEGRHHKDSRSAAEAAPADQNPARQQQ